MNFDFARADSVDPNINGHGQDFNVTKNRVKKFYNENFREISVPDKLLSKFPKLEQSHYIFTSDAAFFSGNNDLPSLPKLMSLKEPFLAFGQPPGYGFNNYNFVIYFADKNHVFMMDIPYGGVYVDNDEGAKKINEAFQKLVNFSANTSGISDGSKLGLFYKSELGGFSPIFNVDRKTLDFREVKKK